MEPAPLPCVHELSATRLRALQADAARQHGVAPHFHDRLGDGSDGPELAVIPPGVFDMGAPEPERGADDLPQRRVVMAHAYALGRHCVTAEAFARHAEASGFRFDDHLILSTGRQPVTNLSRSAAQDYLDWLSRETGQHYRLPTEAEWEYAARAGSASAYCFGAELGCGEGNTGSFRLAGRQNEGWRRFLPFCAPLHRAVEVGSYPANLWGLYDMHGNVWEFTADPWIGAIDPHQNAPLGADNPWYVTKGGSWFESAWHARSAARKPRRVNELDTNLGFRVLRAL